MKKICFLLFAMFSFVACETDEQTPAPFDDVIADFDISEMDQVQFEQALVAGGLSVNQWINKKEGFEWGERYTFPIGYDGVGDAYLFYKDGTSKCIREYFPYGTYEGIMCVTGKWSYNPQTQMLIANKTTDARIIVKVLYYRHPRVILEGIVEDLSDNKIRMDCTIGIEDPEALLESCTIFRTAETE